MEWVKKLVLSLVNRFQCSYRHLYMMYLVIFAVPLILTIILTEIYGNVLERQIMTSMTTMTKQAQATVDSRLQDITILTEQINSHSTLRYLLNCKPPLKNTERYMSLTVTQDLRKLFEINAFVRAVFVYAAFTDTVISSSTHCSSQFFYEKYYRYENMDYPDWRNAMLQQHNQQVWPVQKVMIDNQPVRCLTVLQTLPRGESYRVMGTLTLLIEEKWLLDQIAATNDMEGAAFYIVDSSGQVILSSTDEPLPPDLAMAFEEDLLRETVDDNAYLFSYRKSTVRDWHYILQMPVSRLFGIAIQLRTMFRVALGIVLFFGIALAGALAYTSYLPMRGILSTIRERDDDAGIAGHPQPMLNRLRERISFHDIGELMDRALRDAGAYQKQLPLLIENCVFKLIHGGMEGDIRTNVSLLHEVLGFRFPSLTFCVMCFHVPNDDTKRAADVCEAVRDILQHLRSIEDSGMSCYSTLATEDTIAILASLWPDAEIDVRSVLARQADRIMQLLKEKKGSRYAMGLGQIVEGFDMISDSFHQAILCAAETVSPESIIFYVDIAHTLSPIRHRYPLEKEKILIACVGSGDAVRARRIINELFQMLQEDKPFSQDALDCLKYDLLSTLLKCTQELKTDDNAQQRDQITLLARNLKYAEKAEDIQAKLTDAFERLCTEARQKAYMPQNTLCDRILLFIQSHYTQPEIGLDMVAHAFNIAPGYLSRLFKAQTGGNFIDYLNQLRIQDAAHLLRTTTLSHEEIAKACGISGAQTLNRMFNRILTISPKLYRQMAQDGKFEERIDSTSSGR